DRPGRERGQHQRCRPLLPERGYFSESSPVANGMPGSVSDASWLGSVIVSWREENMVDRGKEKVTHFSNSSDSSDDRPGKRGAANGQVQDVALAGAVAKAVLRVPEVASLSAGHLALAATYGPTQRVTGVVVRRSAQSKMSVEVHVVLRVAATSPAAP